MNTPHHQTILENQSELFAQMEISLGEIAMRWRGTHDPIYEHQLLHHYHTLLNCMIELGFRQSLSVESELPDELMPVAYLNLFQ
jgi:hypothetical protein